MDLLERFKNCITKHALFSNSDHLLVAVSGGVDSIVLCELLTRCGFKIVIAHCNFQLRGAESDRDEAFVKSLADKYRCEVKAKRFDTNKYSEEEKISIQVAARELRYQWFHELLDSIHSETAKWIVTAHHLDDNIETVLMNFFKGTGLSGMRGMLPKSGKLVRPLLFAKKEELLQFAKESELKWVEDSSNESDKYSRNYLRHQLVPLIERIYPSALENLKNTIERFGEIEKFYDATVHRELKKLIETRGEEMHIPILKLKKMASPKTLLYELIAPLGFNPVRVEEVMELMESETGKFLVSDSHRILKNRNWLIISPVQTQMQEYVLVEAHQKHVHFQPGNLELRMRPATEVQLKSGNGVALLDAGKIHYPLMLRRWKQGDYFYPLGMRKKKKLARFFIDQKLSLAQKEKTWVIEMDKKIIWVIGMRIDDRFKVTSSTKQVLQISYDDKVEKK
jgi:tRNA(Ile)-lysidine synthase